MSIQDSSHRARSLLRSMRTPFPLLLLLLLFAVAADADDTEIYTGRTDSSGLVFPNVLMIVDTSGSMSQEDSGAQGSSASRMDELRAAMHAVIDSAEDVKIGLSRFTVPGGPILFPTADLDAPLHEVESGDMIVKRRIRPNPSWRDELPDNSACTQSLCADDAIESAEGVVTLDSNTLALGSFDPAGAEAGEPEIVLDSDEFCGSGSMASCPCPAVPGVGVCLVGAWQRSTSVKHYHGANYYHDQKTESGKSALYVPEIPTAGRYRVSIWYADGGNRASNVPITIVHAGGAITNVTLNQESGGGAWVSLAEVDFDAGSGGSIEISNEEANEYVIIDAIGLECLDCGPEETGPQLQEVALRFPNIEIPQGARITHASINFTAYEVGDGDLTAAPLSIKIESPPKTLNRPILANHYARKILINIIKNPLADSNVLLERGFRRGLKIEESADAEPFQAVDNNITGRSWSSAVSWPAGNWTHPGFFDTTPDLTALVQQVVDDADWCGGAALAFLISGSDATLRRVAYAYDGDHTFDGIHTLAPELNISFAADSFAADACGVEKLPDVRARLHQMVDDDLPPMGGTPMVDALYEAALYFTGGEVDYGGDRGRESRLYDPATGAISKRGSTVHACSDFDRNVGENNCVDGHWHHTHWLNRASHPDSYSGGNNRATIGCYAHHLNSRDCASEQVETGATYRSPMEECQGNHIVLLSDGEAANAPSTSKIRALTGVSSCVDGGNQACGPELAEWLFETDLSDTLRGDQTVKLHTIAFRLGSGGAAYLQRLADAGGGGFYNANNASELVEAFQAILIAASEDNTTFTAPAVTVNAFNRLTHRDELYFALFQPATEPYWSGNIKRYRLGLADDELAVVDVDGDAAVSEDTGFFRESSRSFWTLAADAPDGKEVAAGGAASLLGTSRNLYTYIGSNAFISPQLLVSHPLHESNSAITDAKLGVAADERTELLQWARGIDVLDSDEDSLVDDPRRQMGDPLHTKPVLLSYGGTEENPDLTLFSSNNEGFLHAIDTSDGSEQFAFIPQELLANLDTLYRNDSDDSHPYGLDGSMSVWESSGGKKMVIVGMRRGGRNYYALDVSDRTQPHLQYVIEGGVGNFSELGYTWSQPIPVSIEFDGGEREVLIFGGGFAPEQDETIDPAADTMGRAIYIVDALTGERIWWAGGPGSGADLVLEEIPLDAERDNSLVNAIAADVAVVDLDFNGHADRLYAADLGGRIWRIDLDPAATSASNLATGGLLAELAGSADADQRRFFYRPDVSLGERNGTPEVLLAIGSGHRPNPLGTTIHDRFYLLRDPIVYDEPDWLGITGSTDDDPIVITEALLHDATDNLIDEGATDEIRLAAQTDLANARGWMINLEELDGSQAGEKVLSAAVTFQDRVLFSTFKPTTSEELVCQADVGTGQTYVVYIDDARPSESYKDDDVDDHEDRSVTLARSGIPPEPVILVINPSTTPVVLVGPERIQVGLDPVLLKRYWIEEPNP